MSDDPATRFPFLRSCDTECDEPITGIKTGQIPDWLNGHLLRIGAGRLTVGKEKFHHLFDGFALLHRFGIKNGEVVYQSKFLQSDAYTKCTKAGRIVVSQFATRASTDSDRNLFQRISNVFAVEELTDNDLINIIRCSGETYACTESNFIWKFDFRDLQSLEKVDLSRYVPVRTAGAHSHQDTDGTIYNLGTAAGMKTAYVILKFPPKEKSEAGAFDKGSVVCSIPFSRTLHPSYIHSFGMAKDYFVFIEQPLAISIAHFLYASFAGKPPLHCMQWDSQRQAIFHVVKRSGGKLIQRKYVADAFFTFHHINCYEEENHLVVDICAYQDGDVIHDFHLETLKKLVTDKSLISHTHYAQARRYVLPLCINSQEVGANLVTLKNSEAEAFLQRDGSVYCKHELLAREGNIFVEQPRINYEKYNGRKYKYFYAVLLEGATGLFMDTLIKVNVENKTTTTWKEEGTMPSEPVFVANPNSSDNSDEDDGVLLSALLFADTRKTGLLILDAKTMTEMCRVVFETAFEVPGTFHGIFVEESP